jgi:hypothetical protein
MEVADVRELDGGWVQLVQRFTIEVRDGAKPVCVADSVVRALRA